ncbi:MAG TPA: c-type cytochrome [Clostridia bacterium]|nr:c-type cytochrome [Clostridia bacterium]
MRQKISSLWHTLFGDPGRAFGVVSLMLLVLLASVPAKNHFSEWRHYQNQYQRLVRGRAEAVTLEKHMPQGIQQIWIPEQGVVDRCTTCHVALKETSLRDIQEQPFRTHPPIPHNLSEFGCVTCHRGQGPATTVEEAHHTTLAWEQPILSARYVESGCGQCHLNHLTGTPKLNEGRHLLAREGCVRCHMLTMADGVVMQGADDPPSLVHIADKTTREWMFAWIKDPQRYSSTATMPNFGLSDDDVRDITAFLVAQSAPLQPNAPKSTATPGTATDLQAGTSLYGESFCASCHATQNAAGNKVGGDLGPELTKIGTKAKPEWLQAWLRNPGDYDPDTKMPHYRFDDKQVATLTAFLMAKKDDDLLANVHLPNATPEQVKHGRALVFEYGCASCHGINGIKKPENFAPDLSREGSKPFAQIAFPADVPHTLPDFIVAKVRKPRAFGPSLKMPQFTLTEQQIDAITTALMAQTDRAQTQPVNMRVAGYHESKYQPAGKAGQLMNDLRCFSCHAINGHGGDMAPDLTWEGTSVQRKWLADFLKNPETLRPTLIRRMPKFNLSDTEINILTDYIMTVYQTPAFDRDEIPAAALTPAMAEQGRELFYGKYACQSCHIVDSKADKGYIGPALWSVGTRLNAAWVYHWLKDPQSLRAGSLEPDQHMTDVDARALTAFLMSQKLSQKSSGKQVAKK